MDLEIPLISSSCALLPDKEYSVEVFDREPHGIIIRSKVDKKEIFLPVAEINLSKSGFKRNKYSLTELLNTLSLVQVGKELQLESSNSFISPRQRVESDDAVDTMLKSKITENTTMRTVLLKGLVELCKIKPRQEDAIEWLGEWLIKNNPSQPLVESD